MGGEPVEPRVGSVLVVDDDAVNRMLLARSLEQQGHEAATADDGESALARLREDPPDVVLLDILMPGLDGMEVLERIKTDPALQHLPVIMISAVDEIESVARCIEMGAEDYLPKPFDPVLLRARINAGLTKKRMLELERRQVHDVFSRFLPETVVDDVLAHAGGDLRLGGTKVTGTVVITDIRGFTTFAESTPADVVLEVLNDYLQEMSDAILDHGGTLVSYLGDGILSVFGAPLESEDHADRAVDVADEMLRSRLPRFNASLERRGIGDGFRMGVGINSGQLMSGNVGSQRRLDYTVIGDTVNTAARLQELTKTVGHPVLVGETTATLLRDRDRRLVEVGEEAIRGRSSTVRTWTLAP